MYVSMRRCAKIRPAENATPFQNTTTWYSINADFTISMAIWVVKQILINVICITYKIHAKVVKMRPVFR